MKKVFNMSLISRGFKMNIEQHQALKEICKKKGISVSACVREVMLLVNEGKLKPSPIDNKKANNKLVWVKISGDDYFQFMNTCGKLNYNTFSDCIRDALAIWVDIHKSDQPVVNIKRGDKKKMKGNLVTRAVKISKTDYKKLVVLCNKLGYVSEAKCIREAMLFWLETLKKYKNIRKELINRDENKKEQYILLKFRTHRDGYYQFYDICKEVGYETVVECIRDAVKGWINTQEAKTVER